MHGRLGPGVGPVNPAVFAPEAPIGNQRIKSLKQIFKWPADRFENLFLKKH
jgi:hypothetical protein